MYRIYIYINTLNPRKNQVVQELARQNETEWGKRSNEKYNRFLKRRNKEEIQWQIDLFESEKCKRKLKTTKPKIKKQLDQNHSIPLSQIEIPIILEPLQQQKPPIQKNLLQGCRWTFGPCQKRGNQRREGHFFWLKGCSCGKFLLHWLWGVQLWSYFGLRYSAWMCWVLVAG